MAPAIGHRQAKWVNSIQDRLDVTTYMINSMKSLKLEGLTSWFMDSIQNLRIAEVGFGNKFRSFLIYAVSLCKYGISLYLHGTILTSASIRYIRHITGRGIWNICRNIEL